MLCTVGCLAAGGLAADVRRPFSVDDMFRAEQFGKVLFTSDGRELLFERDGPFERQPDFGRGDAYRPGLFVADVDGQGEPQRLTGAPDDGYRMLGVSPDGAWLAFRRSAREGEVLGVYSLNGGTTREFAFPPEYFSEAAWLGGSLVYPALAEGESRFVYAMRVERLQALASRWEDARRGAVSTASVLTSGGRSARPPRHEFLAQADPRTGLVEQLAAGRYLNLSVAPDGEALAALRQDSLPLDSTGQIEHGVNTGGVAHALIVYANAPQGAAGAVAALAQPCGDFDVLPESLRWSSGSRYLAFVARRVEAAWDTATFYVYDRETGRIEALPLHDLEPYFGHDAARDRLQLEAAWFGDRLAVLAIRSPGSAAAEELASAAAAQPDWFLLGGEEPLNLTERLGSGHPELVAAGEYGGVFLRAGRAWRVDMEGRHRELVPQFDRPLARWPGHGLESPDRQAGRSIVLQARQPPDVVRLLFVDFDSGEVEEVSASSPDARFVAVSLHERRAALVERIGNASVLSIAGSGIRPRTVVTINRHLDEVVGGTPVRVDHPGPDGDERHSWLLLPPNYEGDRPLPTVVNVYPGRAGGPLFRGWTVDRFSALNDHLLAARGYAVLYPSLPLAHGRGPRNPLDGLVDEVLAAVDAAVAMGHVDPERLAVQGQSHGGYAAAALIGLTDRFKAAVATAGIYNLVSFYGVFDPRAWLDVETRGLRMFGASWLETGLGRVGAPPWRVPERYLHNSPLMHVEQVSTPILLIHGDRDFVSITQAEEFFTALTRLNKQAVFVRYFGEDHVPNSPANIRDFWERLFAWYGEHLGPP